MALFGAKKTSQSASKSAAQDKVAPKKSVKAAKPEAASMQDLYSDTTAKVKKSKEGAVAPSLKTLAAARILVRPLITEKATNLGSEDKYVFVVSAEANKISIAKAIQALYQVKPLKVNIMNVSGKKVTRGKIRGQRSDWRKAIITLAKGETIKVYEGV